MTAPVNAWTKVATGTWHRLNRKGQVSCNGNTAIPAAGSPPEGAKRCTRVECGFLNPLVCVCPEPQADPAVNYGTCAICGRKPLSLFRILRDRQVAA